MDVAKLNISLLGSVDSCDDWGGCCTCTMIVNHDGD